MTAEEIFLTSGDLNQQLVKIAYYDGDLSDAHKKQLHGLVVQLAEDEHLTYPQYKDYWRKPGWVLVRVTKTLHGKGFPTLYANDVTIAKLEQSIFPGQTRWLVYSIRKGWNVAVPTSAYAIERII